MRRRGRQGLWVDRAVLAAEKRRWYQSVMSRLGAAEGVSVPGVIADLDAGLPVELWVHELPAGVAPGLHPNTRVVVQPDGTLTRPESPTADVVDINAVRRTSR